jgi:hypothetical protein
VDYRELSKVWQYNTDICNDLPLKLQRHYACCSINTNCYNVRLSQTENYGCGIFIATIWNGIKHCPLSLSFCLVSSRTQREENEAFKSKSKSSCHDRIWISSVTSMSLRIARSDDRAGLTTDKLMVNCTRELYIQFYIYTLEKISPLSSLSHCQILIYVIFVILRASIKNGNMFVTYIKSIWNIYIMYTNSEDVIIDVRITQFEAIRYYCRQNLLPKFTSYL